MAGSGAVFVPIAAATPSCCFLSSSATACNPSSLALFMISASSSSFMILSLNSTPFSRHILATSSMTWALLGVPSMRTVSPSCAQLDWKRVLARDSISSGATFIGSASSRLFSVNWMSLFLSSLSPETPRRTRYLTLSASSICSRRVLSRSGGDWKGTGGWMGAWASFSVVSASRGIFLIIGF